MWQDTKSCFNYVSTYEMKLIEVIVNEKSVVEISAVFLSKSYPISQQFFFPLCDYKN
jgi:hypothetical protein